MEAFEHAASLLRERDHDRYIADLFAPEPARRHLFALHAFDTEIARIRFVVSEPALGEIRLQWWRDSVVDRQGAGSPLAEALLAAIDAHGLPKATFDAYLTARIFDLYNDAMPTMADFEGYAGETTAAMLQLSAVVLLGAAAEATADASGHAGVAIALRDALLGFAVDARRSQLFLPRDRFETAGVSPDEAFAGRRTDGLDRALADLRRAALEHADKAAASLRSLPQAVRPAFLPLALVRPDLDRLARAGPFTAASLPPRWRRQWRLWRAARRGIG